MDTLSLPRLTKVTLLLVLFVIPIERGAAQVLDRSVARVRLTTTESIGQRALRQQVNLYERQTGRSLSEQDRREVLEIMINERLIEQAAERDGVSVSDREVDQRIRQERQSLGRQMSDEQFELIIEQQLGMEYDDYREELRTQLLQQRYIQSVQQERFAQISEPSEQEIRSVYNENIQEFINPAMVRFDHIYIDGRNLDENELDQAVSDIEALWEQIDSGEYSFSEAMDDARENDPFGASDFGYLAQNDRQLRQQLGGNFVDSLFELNEEEVSGVYTSQVGYHIVRVTDKRDRRFLELHDPLVPGQQVTVRDNIVNYIMNNRMQQEFMEATEEVISRLRDEAEIDINESNLDW